jgi:HrpA-like RNA helicase
MRLLNALHRLLQKFFDAVTGISSLQVTWISQTSATQRRGRAGRTSPGVVFRLFSRTRFRHMAQFQTPEILRMPLAELCLHSKLLSAASVAIADFVASTPQPPSFLATRNAVAMLKVRVILKLPYRSNLQLPYRTLFLRLNFEYNFFYQ